MSKRDMPEFNSWRAMRHRCNSPKNPSWSNYGGRGIRVCSEWDASFEAFLRDVGMRPAGATSLERIDVNGNYEPGNVRWASIKEQNRNRRGCMNEQQADRARFLLSLGLSVVSVARIVGSTKPAIYQLQRGLTWSDDAPKRGRRALRKQDDHKQAEAVLRRARAR